MPQKEKELLENLLQKAPRLPLLKATFRLAIVLSTRGEKEFGEQHGIL
jgi:hypothetical protein